MAAEPANVAVNEEDGRHSEAYNHLEDLYWGGVITWAGLVFWADSLDYLPRVGGAGAWSWLFLWAGIYALFMVYFRLGSRDYPNPKTEDYVWAGGWTVLGLKGFAALDIVWPVVLVAIGVAILGKALLQGPPHA